MTRPSGVFGFALTVLSLVLMGGGLEAQAQMVTAPVDPNRSVIDYTGSATLHDWTGTSRQVDGTLRLNPDTPDSSRVSIRAPVSSFDSGRDRRDRNMREVTEADTYPYVSFRTTDIRSVQWGRANEGKAGTWEVTGDLTFHGETHSVDATVDVRIKEDSVEARAQFPVSLTRFGIERPELLWTAPIADTIRIDARIKGAVREESPSPSRITEKQNEVTGTRRLVSTDIRDVTKSTYAGRRMGLHTEVQFPTDGERAWVVAFYGFTDQPTGMADAPTVDIQADGQSVDPERVDGLVQELDDGKTVEIVEAVLSRAQYETIANALSVSTTIGETHVITNWRERRDLRLVLERVVEAKNPMSADEGN